VKPNLQKCYERRQAGTTCLDFSDLWCDEFENALFRMQECESFSRPCWLRLLCHSPCICPSWKAVQCGTMQSGNVSECTADLLADLLEGPKFSHKSSDSTNAPSMFQRVHRNGLLNSREVGDHGEVDSSAMAKCTA
jgi:hypothetical protein